MAEALQAAGKDTASDRRDQCAVNRTRSRLRRTSHLGNADHLRRGSWNFAVATLLG
ncbi:BQ5605_C006g04304 [Microbotryum silenes-dioicae]|uniref:BQ5605_C006g04166 protein n=1 Tax=Microbotryum silenes-dioicae TaxID=796604 RepID=A0A2X0MAR1_9BASI|nr:BQ5605_C006g04166 [Microbotryum silenes-dioicae]SGY56870.1 BQ5605_C006g04184 [Microbotryum silenes-dioicae]SGY57759.1 BQ5605_C006g04304 [Microbotryum silenes-dioicae]